MDFKKLGFTYQEIKDIAVSALLLAFIFFYPGTKLFSMPLDTIIMQYLFYFVILTLAFIPHELAHKFAAMHYKCVAQYQIWWSGLKWALVLAIITNGRFVIAAPGAVVIYSSYIDLWGRHRTIITPRMNAIISLSGPLTNIFIALIMLALGGGSNIAASIAYISSFLALFNLIPFSPFDGEKIFTYKKSWWALAFAGALSFLIFA